MKSILPIWNYLSELKKPIVFIKEILDGLEYVDAPYWYADPPS